MPDMFPDRQRFGFWQSEVLWCGCSPEARMTHADKTDICIYAPSEPPISISIWISHRPADKSQVPVTSWSSSEVIQGIDPHVLFTKVQAHTHTHARFAIAHIYIRMCIYFTNIYLCKIEYVKSDYWGLGLDFFLGLPMQFVILSLSSSCSQ